MRVNPARCRSLVEVVRLRGDAQAASPAYTFIESGEREAASLTWAALDRRSRAIGAAIASRVSSGSRVLLVFPPGLDFVPSFYGVLCAGSIAVPTYPPSGGRADRTVARLRGMIGDAGISLVVAPAATCARSATLESLVPELRGLPWLAVEDVADDQADRWRDPRCSGGDIALLQYTSGSTGTPRGVMVTHENLLNNLAHGARLGAHDGGSVAVSWLPVNHDMGLIDGVLQPAYSGFPAYLLAPAAFLQRPLRWLQAISRLRATHSGGPNFAYDLCVRRVAAEDRRSLDLSSWRVAYNGSEPVRHATLEAFHRAFGECGFRWNAFRPAYGLAESTLLVTSSGHGDAPARLDVDRAALARGEVVCCTGVNGRTSATLVSSGVLDGTSRVAIVNPSTCQVVRQGRIGEIWVAGPSVACGYWRRPEETNATFNARLAGSSEGPFLRTGDLGFAREGRLFVTGRIKDVLIIRGLKHYPQDIERTAEGAHPAVRAGGCAAFAMPRRDEEAIALVAEIDPRMLPEADSPATPGAILAALRRAIVETHHVAPSAVALVPAGSLPKTTSGKLQRYLCREAFATGMLDIIEQWTDAALFERAAS